MSTIAKVAEFHEAFGQPSADRPRLPEARQRESVDIGIEGLNDALETFRYGAQLGCRRCLRLALITEELRELAESLRDDDSKGCLDALVDLRYVSDGTVIEFGLHRQAATHARSGNAWSTFDEAFRRVHAANMAKLGPDGKPILDERGKIRKPEEWVAPDLSDLVRLG